MEGYTCRPMMILTTQQSQWAPDDVDWWGKVVQSLLCLHRVKEYNLGYIVLVVGGQGLGIIQGILLYSFDRSLHRNIPLCNIISLLNSLEKQ